MKSASIIRVAALAATMATVVTSEGSTQVTTGIQFVNGITINGNSTDLSTGSSFDRRLGMFSDLYYDSIRGEWWGLSDRGPGGGFLPYETRVTRFTLDVNSATGAISNFQVAVTIKFMGAGNPFNGIAPLPTDVLGNAFDPEGIVIHPTSGNLLVSDEYGPSLIEFDRAGNLVRRFTTPANLVPRDGLSGVPNFAGNGGNTAGKTTNRGFEGLAISPDGKFVYATLQSAMLDEGATNGTYARIVKFDMATGDAVAQFAYQMETAAQGRGLSSLVALGGDKFLALERNNRGIGVGATLAGADKNVYEIDLSGATDVSNISITNGVLPVGVVPITKVAKVLDLDANTLLALGNRSPEKWEGLAIGPKLANGSFLMLAGTDNDYSVSQNASGTQFDVWFDFGQSDPYASSIQCPLGATINCFATADGSSATLTDDFSLLPGILHSYSAEFSGYVAPTVVPEPQSLALLAIGMSALGLVRMRTRRRMK